MTKTVAASISDLMIKHGAELNESLQMVQMQCDEATFNKYRLAVANLMTSMLVDVMNPIYAEHPDLKPPELR